MCGCVDVSDQVSGFVDCVDVGDQVSGCVDDSDQVSGNQEE